MNKAAERGTYIHILMQMYMDGLIDTETYKEYIYDCPTEKLKNFIDSFDNDKIEIIQ